LEITAFEPVAPDWTPRSYADERRAWQGSATDLPGVTLRVEAASHRGTPVGFQIIGPWARPVRMQAPRIDRATEIVSLVASLVVVPLCLVGGVLLARRNLKLGRGDRRGAWTFAGLVFALTMLQWAFGAAHVADLGVEQGRLAATAAWALLSAIVFGLLYLAIERIRRIWPQLLIAWSRVLTGRVRDRSSARPARGGGGGDADDRRQRALPAVALFGWPPFGAASD
jgi:hypothetical protein